jgi:hemerythrin
MSLITWSDEFNLGLEGIDAEHRWLVNAINDFHSAYMSDDAEAVDTLLIRINDYMNEHFHNEEDFLKRHNYPGLESHRNAHKAITEKVHEFELRIRESEDLPVSELTGFMLEWIYDHIMKTDKAFVEYIRTVQNS